MLTRWAPFELVSRADRDADDLFRRAFGELAGTRTARTWAPAMDIFTKDDALHVKAEMPGIDPEQDVDIEITDGVLRIEGERRFTDETTEEGGYWRRELTHGRFERAIGLPDGVEADAVKASYDAGILHIVVPLPKKPSSKVRVEVGANGAHRELEN